MGTAITLFLAEHAPELAQAHDELYPERIPEIVEKSSPCRSFDAS